MKLLPLPFRCRCHRLPGRGLRSLAVAAMTAMALIGVTHPLKATNLTFVWPGETLTVTGYYSTDIFELLGGTGTLVLHYSGATPLDYDRGTWFRGSGILRKTGTGTVYWGGKTTTFDIQGTGSLIDVREGTLVGGSHGNENWSGNWARLNVEAGARFEGVEANVRVNGITGNGVITSGYNGSGYQQFTFGVHTVASDVHTFGGTLSNHGGFAGRYVKTGAGTQYLTGTNTFTGGLRVEGGVLSIGNGGTTGSINSDVELAGGRLIFNRSNDVLFSKAISNASGFAGAGEVVKAGAGTLTLMGNNGGFSGGWLLNSGWVQFSSLNAFGAGQISFNGGGLRWAPGSHGDISFRFKADSGVYLLDTNGNNVTLAANLNTTHVVKQGAGTLTLSGNNTFSGTHTLSAGTIALGHANGLGSTSRVLTASGTTLDIKAHTFDLVRVHGSGTVTGSGTLRLTGQGWSSANNGRQQITGSLRLLVEDGGGYHLWGDNSFTGGLMLTNGYVYARHVNALGSGPVHIGEGRVYYLTESAFDLSRVSGTGLFQSNGMFYDRASDATIAVDLIANGTPGFVKSGASHLTLSGEVLFSNTEVVVSEGRLSLTGGEGAAFANKSTFVIHHGGILDAGYRASLDLSVFGGNGVLTGSGSWVHAGTADASYDLSFAGSASISKTGSARVTLTGQSTSYTGTVSVDAGELVVNGSIASSERTTVRDATLAGSGTVGELHMETGSVLAPGNSIGNLTAGDTTWSGGATYQWELADALGEAGTGYDTLWIEGVLSFAEGLSEANPLTIAITSLQSSSGAGETLNFDPESQYRFVLATAHEVMALSDLSAFVIDASGFQNAFTGTWSVHLFQTTLELHYEAIPEPGTWALLGSALAAVAYRLRGRMRRAA